ncbi:MAG: DNA-binding protein [Chloroflexi bacterium]|nr:MAG: DNA-binding protein [Chloroflexota bacterium]
MEELMTAQELYRILKVSKMWPYRAAKKGLIPHYRMGDLVRFSRTDVEAYLGKCRVEGKAVKVVEAKEKKVGKNKDEVCSSETSYIKVDKVHSWELKHTVGVCRGCMKRTDGKIDYLTDGFCETCRPRPNM